MSTLHDRLTAAITARLDVARAVPGSGHWSKYTEGGDDGAAIEDAEHGDPGAIIGDDAMAEHIASWDPTTAIRVLEALQEVVGRHAPDRGRKGTTPPICAYEWGDGDGWGQEWPCPDVLSAARALGVEVE